MIRSTRHTDLLSQALQQQKAGQHSSAMAVFDEILKAEPRHPDALYFKALSKHLAGETHEAIDLMRRAIAVDPAHPDRSAALADLLRVSGNLEAAAEVYLQSLRLEPAQPEVYFKLAEICLLQHREQDALAALTRAVTLRPDHVAAWRQLAVLLRRRRDYRRAFGALAAGLRAAPGDPTLHFERGRTHFEIGEHDAAAEALRECLRLEPTMTEAKFILAAMGRAPTPDAAPPRFVASLFDGYAPTFDDHLRSDLSYRGPEAIAEALTRLSLPARSMVVLDAGCGTGLLGPVLKPFAKTLHGVDLSPAMIDRARQTNRYDELFVEELMTFLKGRSSRYDLVVAADVLVYFGELAKVLSKSASALKAGGMFIFTTEVGEGADFHLLPAGRFVHTPEYVGATAKAAGFVIVSQEPVVIRKEADNDVASLLTVLRRS